MTKCDRCNSEKVGWYRFSPGSVPAWSVDLDLCAKHCKELRDIINKFKSEKHKEK